MSNYTIFGFKIKVPDYYSSIGLCLAQVGIGAAAAKVASFFPQAISIQSPLIGALASCIAATPYNFARYACSYRLSKCTDWKQLMLRISFVAAGVLLSSFATPWLAHYMLNRQITKIATAALSSFSVVFPFVLFYEDRFFLFLGTVFSSSAISALAAQLIRLISTPIRRVQLQLLLLDSSTLPFL